MSHGDNTGLLAGRVAVITGGANGMGRSISILFAKEGARVAIFDKDAAASVTVAKEPEKDTGQIAGFRVDVSASREVDTAVKAVSTRWNRIDILVNCAAIHGEEWFADGDEEMWDSLMAVNLKGTFLPTKAVLPFMLEQRYGRIINFASAAGKVGSEREAVYSATKGGVIAFTKALAKEVAKYGININAICPGPIETPMLQDLYKTMPKIASIWKRIIPLQRTGKPEEVAETVLFLASKASYITGQPISVDGGWTMT